VGWDQLTPEQRELRDLLRTLARERIAPRAAEIDSSGAFPWDIVELYRENDVFALFHDEQFGGTGTGALLALVAIEEIAKVCATSALILAVQELGSLGLKLAGTPEQQQRWLPRLASGESLAAYALTESGSGSDSAAMRTTARRDGDEYVLNGQKTWITNGPYADTIVCYAKLDDGSGLDPRRRPVLTFILSSDMEGLERSAPLRKMGQHASPTGQLFFSDVRVGRDRLLGGTETPQGGGRESAKDNFVTERAGVAAMALGIIEECLRLSIDYARSRTLWERPISEFQLIQLKLARMEVARVNTQNLVFMHLERSAAGATPTLAEASAMKLYAARAAFEVADEAIQLFGGNGYVSEYRVEQLARDARVLQIYAGTDEIQVVAIAKDLLNR
jgi:acyl-CoA dehydrogenase